ncbi:organic solute transporter subunit alpha-like [Bolinopsis microptera]|uniref:organic solute transporter subunit alpha-like n=1 Tax=Bolinopsis microptera TaxID=2820187 RepID=UPI003079B8F9
MYFSGMIVPKAMSKVTYIAETYESVSLLFFLRLLLTYLGGKKETREKLTNTQVKLNSPPICCLTFLPKVTFSKHFLLVNEIFIAQLVVFQLVFGYIDLLIGLDESHSHPTDLIEHEYSQVYHILMIFSLLLAVYGLGGIYHTAEEHLKHYKIYRKFILYKAFVTVVKLEEFLLSYVITYLVKRYGINLTHGAFRPDLRVHMWCYFIIEVEAVITFPFLIRAYSTADYPGRG